MNNNNNCNLSYTKRKNDRLFASLKKDNLMDMEHVQNYVPIYNRFFNLTETNYENVVLDTSYIIHDILQKNQDCPNIYKCVLEKNVKRANPAGNETTNRIETMKSEVFCKIAPLIDPYKFMIGKLFDNPDIFNLPVIESSPKKSSHSTLLDVNNSAYVDGLFVYLSNMLNTRYGFVHGILYYGTYLGIKRNFKVNIYDDIEYLAGSTFFNRHKNVDFQVDDYSYILSQLQDDDMSAKKRPPLKIDIIPGVEKLQGTTGNGNIDSGRKRSVSITSIKSIDDSMFAEVFTNNDVQESTSHDVPMVEINSVTLEDLSNCSLELTDCISYDIQFTSNGPKSQMSNSTCSSRTSCTSLSDIDNHDASCNADGSEDGNESDGSDEWTDDGTEDSAEEDIYATLPRFPVELVFMEKMEYTLDKLMVENDVSEDEWYSIFMQIIMILITYQKAFSFTHNDLHTNNVMFSATDKKYLYYRYNNCLYRVPTHGRIAKIIDFGRAIYKYNGLTMCSDSYKPGNDASSQYNTEPYLNDEKPRLEPNMSFDLCRLGTSMYDEMVEDPKDIVDDPIAKLVNEWCKDDNGRNILYKKNGDERYPGFKLYKMIARIVHAHTPEAQLSRPAFQKYKISNKELPQKMRGNVMDIDKIPLLSLPHS